MSVAKKLHKSWSPSFVKHLSFMYPSET